MRNELPIYDETTIVQDRVAEFKGQRLAQRDHVRKRPFPTPRSGYRNHSRVAHSAQVAVAGYRQIQRAIKRVYGFEPSRESIAFMMAVHGCSPKRRGWHRGAAQEMKPCSLEHKYAIEDALRYFGMISRK